MKVDEIFGPTIQGEGALAGAVSMFVRLGGCDYRCAWCPTPATPILMADLTCKPARQVSIGEAIAGAERQPAPPRRQDPDLEGIGPLRTGRVLAMAERQAELVRV